MAISILHEKYLAVSTLARQAWRRKSAPNKAFDLIFFQTSTPLGTDTLTGARGTRFTMKYKLRMDPTYTHGAH